MDSRQIRTWVSPPETWELVAYTDPRLHFSQVMRNLGTVSPGMIALLIAFCHLLYFIFLFFPFLAVPRGIWDLSSLTRDQTHAPCIGSTEC